MHFDPIKYLATTWWMRSFILAPVVLNTEIFSVTSKIYLYLAHLDNFLKIFTENFEVNFTGCRGTLVREQTLRL